MFALKIDGVERTGFSGHENWTKSASRDFSQKIFRTKGAFEFQAFKALYRLIYETLMTEGYCKSIDARIFYRESDVDAWELFWRGEMKPQTFEFDLLKGVADGEVLENIWAAKFENSSEQSVFLQSEFSKNGTPISPATSFLGNVFDPYDSTFAAYLPDQRQFYRVYDVFSYLVEWFTDGLATFESDYFDVGGEGRQYCITTGFELRRHLNQTNPQVSFAEMFDEMNRKLNLWIMIDGTFDSPVLRIEPQEYMFSEQELLTITNPEGIKMSIDLDQIYTKISIGSNAPRLNDVDNSIYPTPPYFAWNDEEYNTSGSCEFENQELNLFSGFKIDHNSITHQIKAPSGSGDEGDFDDDIFIIEVDESGNAYKFTTEFTFSLTDTPLSGDNTYYIYNYNLTNIRVLEHWFNGIPAEVIQSIGEGLFARVDTVTTTPIVSALHDLDYSNDVAPPAEDQYGMWFTAAEDPADPNQFRAPVSDVYRLFVECSISVNALEGDTFTIFGIAGASPSGVALYSKPIDTVIVPAGPPVPFTHTLSGEIFVTLDAGQIIKPRFENNLPAPRTVNIVSSYAEFGNTSPFQHVIQQATTKPLIFIYDVEKFRMSREDFEKIDGKTGFVRVIDTQSQRSWKLWPKDLQFNPDKCIVEKGEFIGTPPLSEPC